MEKRSRKHIAPKAFIISIIITLIIGLAGGYGISYIVKATSSASKKDTDLLSEIMGTLQNSFYDSTGSKTSLTQRMLSGMVDGLGDIHTSYLTKQEQSDFDSSVDGTVEGIGVEYVKVKSGAMITNVYKNTPASKALKAGDILLSANGVDLSSKSITEIPKFVKGDANTTVTLKIKRNNKTLIVKVTRKAIETDLYAYEATHNDELYGYIHLTTVGNNTAEKVEKVLAAFKEKNVKNIVLDLRNNGGGYVGTAKDILSLFNKKNETLFYIKDKEGKLKSQKDNTKTEYVFDKKYVLINGNTASSAELIAETLKEKNGFTVAGEKSYGKSIIQVEKTLSNGDALKYTNSMWITYDKKVINKKGITPDLKLKGYEGGIDASYFTEVYKQDQVDNRIKNMEYMLSVTGYKPGRTDGYFSAGAKNALKSFQSKMGMSATGDYDYNTCELLMSQYLSYIKNEKNDTQLTKVVSLL